MFPWCFYTTGHRRDGRSFKVGGQEWGCGGRAPVESRGKPLVAGMGRGDPPQKLTIRFCENMLFCHGFKNDIAIVAFTAYKCSIHCYDLYACVQKNRLCLG